jgi:folate-dependent phosphoribosylglycinamide formyltransferase PurN
MDIAVLCSQSLDGFQRAVIEPFFSAESTHRIVGCVIDSRPVPSPWRRTLANLARGRGGYVLIMAVNRLRRRRAAATSTAAVFGRRRVPIVRTKDPYGEETIQAIRDLRPEVLLLIGGFGIIKAPLLNLAPQGVLSYHHGDMREYRGQPPAFWELYNGEQRIGVTVQRLNAGIDCGEPVVERSFPIRRNDTLGSLSQRIFAGTTDMLEEAVQRLEDSSRRAETITSVGRLYTLPNLRQWLVFHARVGQRVLVARLPARRRQRPPD